MKGFFWLAVAASVIAACGVIWYSLRRWKEKQFAEQQRIASFMAATAGPKLVEAAAAPVVRTAPVAGDKVVPQRLLFEAAHKAGEAGEPALAIQLYARLLARYPETAFAAQARAAVESEKKKLAKA